MGSALSVHVISLHTAKTSKGRRKFGQCACGWISPCVKSAHAAQDIVVKHHPQAFCPTPAKRRYATRRDAELALLDFWRGAPAWKKEIRRAYECDCGRWHTTSKPA